MHRFWTRSCHGCADASPHDSHLTLFGRIYFWPFKFRRAASTQESVS